MARYRLGDICMIISGSTPKTEVAEYWDGDFKWITPAELNDDSYIIEDSARKLTALGVQKTGLTPFPAGTIILSSRAPIGKVAIAGCEMYCNQGFKNLICSEIVHNKYLFWYLKGKTEYLNSLGRGATFKEISKQIVGGIEIELPPMEEQIAIAQRFEQLNLLLHERKQEITMLDQLIKARFVEIFGDILSGYTYPKKRLSDVVTVGSSKRIFAAEYVNEGIPFYRSKEIRELGSGLKPSVELYISPDRYDEIKKHSGIPKRGDILIAAIGATIGYSWIVNTDEPFYYKDGNLLILSISDKVNPVFLNHVMAILIDDYKTKGAAGSAQLALTIEKVEKMEIPYPPVSVQDEFATFVSQADKSKLTIQASLDQLETLKQSLMQKYFG